MGIFFDHANVIFAEANGNQFSIISASQISNCVGNSEKICKVCLLQSSLKHQSGNEVRTFHMSKMALYYDFQKVDKFCTHPVYERTK